MIEFDDAQRIIGGELEALDLDRTPDELYEPVRYILSIGGKRMRPALVLMSCSLFNDTVQPAIKAALAFEVFHNFTLLHDDIMDQSSVRRGQPTVHEKWSQNTAILSGDVMSILSYQILADAQGDFLGGLLQLFNQTALQVCEGQQMDMNFENRLDVTVEEYLDMIRLKTAVLIAAGIKGGALAGGAEMKDADLLYDFGLNLGIAFQLRDDYLDVFGTTEKLGKQIGNDIITNKKTFLLIKALELAGAEMKKDLMEMLVETNLPADQKIQRVIDIYKILKINQISNELADSYYSASLQYLERVSVLPERKKALARFAETMMKREQ